MNIPSIFSLIDTLCIFLCGGVIVNVAISQINFSDFRNNIPCHDGSTEFLLMIFVCYLVGLIFHRLVECLSCRLRRSPKLMFLSLNRYMAIKNGTRQKSKCASFKCGCALFVCLLFERHRPCPDLTGLYDKCYTELCKENMIGDIKVLEGQLAFVRNSIFLLPILFFCKICMCCKILVFIVSLQILVYLWENIQMKQFEMVWDYAYCLNPDKHHQKYNQLLAIIKAKKI